MCGILMPLIELIFRIGEGKRRRRRRENDPTPRPKGSSSRLHSAFRTIPTEGMGEERARTAQQLWQKT